MLGHDVGDVVVVGGDDEGDAVLAGARLDVRHYNGVNLNFETF